MIAEKSLNEDQTSIQKKYTYDDYVRLTKEGDRCELIDGELIYQMTSPIIIHQIILSNINFELNNYVKNKNLGKVFVAPTDVKLATDHTFQPDIFFIKKERFSIINEKNIDGVPDLVVEILSPSTAYYDLRKKFSAYETFGVKEYWIVDPKEQTFESYDNNPNGFVISQKLKKTGVINSKSLEGFSFEITSIWD